ncbi:MAG: M1 family aminopeptidase [Candidatus Sulfotelmatobacter sp.]
MGTHTYVTKVPAKLYRFAIVLAASLTFLPSAHAYSNQAPPTQAPPHKPGPAESLYLQLSSIGLDTSRVFRVRDGSIDRPAIHISLEDGTIAFTKDVMGKITGAFFEGDGEVLLVPPNEVERSSMTLFTGMAILEERFSTAYFRFNDNTAIELQPGLRAPEDAAAFVAQWDEMARTLAPVDAMRLLATFSEMLPTAGRQIPKDSPPAGSGDRLLHARLQSDTLGVFDVIYDSTAAEQVEAGQAKTKDGTVYYDVWTSFSAGIPANGRPAVAQTLPTETESREDPISLRSYIINAEVKPPKELDAEVNLNLEVLRDASQFLVFELSRFLKIQSVEENGRAVEYLQNPAVEGTQLARSGNDLVAVILSEPARKGQKISLRFAYGGEVLAEAGNGLLYVGERGNWYPNRGLAMSDYDLTFHYPQGWTLVATGKPSEVPKTAAPTEFSRQIAQGDQVGRWVSERPIPIAGFDLGKYVRAAAQAGNVHVDAYATGGVERGFPSASSQIETQPDPTTRTVPLPLPSAPIPLSPARNAAAVAESAALAIRYYAERFGPFPYSNLALTQLPGRESQGWPGLIFLSSYAFLTPEERREIHMNPSQEFIDEQIPAHETAHQWWGDLVTWRTYRDQWFSEGLANYSALMILRQRNPAGFRQVMEKYRQDLLAKNKEGNLRKDAGPVTLGSRLLSSNFPEGYEAISYGRGTWLFYMLDSMMQDAAAETERKSPRHESGEDPFIRALRQIRERYQGKAITTSQLLGVFAEGLPTSLRYEGKSSLDWFMDGWINGTSLPKLQLHAVKLTTKGTILIASGMIQQKDAPDTLVTSVPIYASISGKKPVLLGRVFADGPETPFHLSAPAGTHKLLLDPYETIPTSSSKPALLHENTQ